MKVRIKLGQDTWLVALFAILPFIDSLNGYYVSMPIGIVYKFFLCIILLVNILSKGTRLNSKWIRVITFSAIYIIFSIVSNLAMGGVLINTDFPIKLYFNIVLLCLLIINIDKKIITPNTLCKIFDNSIWIFLFCFLIPYFLGIGNNVYSGSIGYKAFFVSQNELSLAIITMSFYLSYKLRYEITAQGICKFGLLLLCGLLLNTKSTIIISFIVVVFWVFPIIAKGKAGIKLISIVTVIIGAFLLHKTIITAVSQAMERFTILVNEHYAGSFFTGILSGRNYTLKLVWNQFKEKHMIFHFLFGNGFCSEYLIEMDLLDIFFYLGIVGVISTLVFLFWVLRKSILLAREEGNFVRPILFLILIIYLSLTGHVLFMAMSGCYFILYCCFLIYYKQENGKVSKNKGY